MSSTRKPNPFDRGVPAAHKPSRKLALEEVLRSLQDLVQNELYVEPPASGQPQAKTEPSTPARAPDTGPAVVEVPVAETVVLEGPADRSSDAAPGSGTTAETAAPATIDLDDTSARSKSGGDANVRPAGPGVPPGTARGGRNKAVAGGAAAIPTGGQQQELPHLDQPAPAPEPPTPVTLDLAADAADEAATAEPGGSAAIVPPAEASAPVIDVAEPPQLEPGSAAAAPALGEAVDFSDIPILEDAVELSDEFPTLGALDPADEPAPAKPLPAPQDARRLAIQVAARLNVLLRKEGKPVLATDVIARLAHELEEALAKVGPNMENKRR